MNIISSTANSDPMFRGGGREVALSVRPMRSARGLRLRVDAVRGRVLLTIPHRHSRKAAIAWAEERRVWVEQLLARAPQGRPFVPGARIPFDDSLLTIEWRAAAPRSVTRDDGRLLVGGPAERVAARVEAWLKAQALVLLCNDTEEFARRAGIGVTKVSVTDPGSRWGSCSAAGAIAYSWRLALAPSFVRRSTAAHEVAHRLHLDHSPAFHAAHRRLLGEDPAPARLWLRRHGAELHLLGRGD